MKIHWNNKYQTIIETEAYKLFLGGHLEKLHTEWKKYFDQNSYDETKSFEVMQREIMKIFKKCGLSFANVTEGIYIKVDSIT